MNTFDKNDLSGFVGKHLVYTYDNGWNYEIYVKNATTLDYRIHSGIVGNRWVRDQQAFIVRVANKVYKISWTEPTGTDVSLIANLEDNIFHGTIFFPRWVIDHPEKTVCFQNDHLKEMALLREQGPVYPTEVIDEFATITFIRDCGADNETVINCAADELPANFPENLK
ncbi:phenolic acid decarboxylase [Sodalis sp. C49]|uniref:phenolic acid decarboxylase n=1 Tax=Sodalis sp. C49 TaxID=3228929 RepID=UPI003965BF22